MSLVTVNSYTVYGRARYAASKLTLDMHSGSRISELKLQTLKSSHSCIHYVEMTCVTVSRNDVPLYIETVCHYT